MPLFQFQPPPTSNLTDYILYVWQCLGKEAPSIPDLKYFLSFRAKLIAPSLAQEVIDAAVRDGVIVNQNNILSLSLPLQERLAKSEQIEQDRIWQQLQRQEVKASALGARSFNDYFRELLPGEIKNKTFVIPLQSIEVRTIDTDTNSLQSIIAIEGDKTTIDIDGINRRVTHVCETLTPDYREARQFCHHLGALFRFLQKKYPDVALRLAQSMVDERSSWIFE